MFNVARGNPRIRTGNSISGVTMFNMHGMDEVIQMLRSLQSRAPDVYNQELYQAGLRIASSAKSKVHDVSGALSSSIHLSDDTNKSRPKVSIIAGGVAAPHAHLVEFGHRQLNKKGEVIGDVPAHSFLRNAFDGYKERLLNDLRQAIGRLIISS